MTRSPCGVTTLSSTATLSASCVTVKVCFMSGGMLWLRLWSSSQVPPKFGRDCATARAADAASRRAEQRSAVFILIGGFSFFTS
jgi:hypothetical protein